MRWAGVLRLRSISIQPGKDLDSDATVKRIHWPENMDCCWRYDNDEERLITIYRILYANSITATRFLYIKSILVRIFTVGSSTLTKN